VQGDLPLKVVEEEHGGLFLNALLLDRDCVREIVCGLEDASWRGNILTFTASGAKNLERLWNLLEGEYAPLVPNALLQPHSNTALDRTSCASPVDIMRLITEEFCSHQSRTP
jgi:hypothetical protein